MRFGNVDEVTFQCPCGWIGSYNRVKGHQLGSRNPICKTRGPDILRDDSVSGKVSESTVEEELQQPEEDEEEIPEEGVPTAAQGRPPESKVAGPSTAKGPVGVPSPGISAEPSSVRLSNMYPVEMMALYDWAKIEQSYRGSFIDFIVESFLDYWFGQMACPHCGAVQPTYTLAIVPTE